MRLNVFCSNRESSRQLSSKQGASTATREDETYESLILIELMDLLRPPLQELLYDLDPIDAREEVPRAVVADELDFFIVLRPRRLVVGETEAGGGSGVGRMGGFVGGEGGGGIVGIGRRGQGRRGMGVAGVVEEAVAEEAGTGVERKRKGQLVRGDQGKERERRNELVIWDFVLCLDKLDRVLKEKCFDEDQRAVHVEQDLGEMLELEDVYRERKAASISGRALEGRDRWTERDIRI
jgi:hypothetical protein